MKKDQYTCKANGCTLPMQFITDYDDRGKPKWGLCQHHHGKPRSQWVRISEIIKLEAARQKAINIISSIQQLSHSEYAPLTGETIQHWSARLSKSIRSDIHTASNKQSNKQHMKQIKQTLSQGARVSE